MARERSEHRELTWRMLFERSELCAGPWTRAPQGSRSAAETASVARRAPTARPFAATTVRVLGRTPANDRTGPQATATFPRRAAA